MEESIHIDLFYAEKTEQLKRLVCDRGKRMWERGYVDGNGGNISVRLSKECVLCTPTYMSKGRMQPSDLCMVCLLYTSDPWGATAVDLKENSKCRKYVKADMDHTCRIKHFEEITRQDIIETLKSWLK